MNASELSALAQQYLPTLDASLHEPVLAFVAWAEAQEALKQQLAEAQALLAAHGYVVTAPAA